MTTEATLQCTCAGTCGGHFRFVGGGGGGEATDKLPFNAGESTIQARDEPRVTPHVFLFRCLPSICTKGGSPLVPTHRSKRENIKSEVNM